MVEVFRITWDTFGRAAGGNVRLGKWATATTGYVIQTGQDGGVSTPFGGVMDNMEYYMTPPKNIRHSTAKDDNGSGKEW